jgi:hypothetical protein
MMRKKAGCFNLKRVLPGVLFLMVVFCPTASARIVFDSEFIQGEGGDTVLIDYDGAGAVNTQVQFGNDLDQTENGLIQWDITSNSFILTDSSLGTDRAPLSFELENGTALPGGVPGLGLSGNGRIFQLAGVDSIAPGCTITPFCGAGTYVWNGSTWISLTGTTSSNFNKLVTVGSSGADYLTIAGAASYLQTLSGGIILLSAETHLVTTSVDLANVILIGKDASRTTIQLSGIGQFDTFDTTFEYLTLDVDAITDDMAIDVQTGSNSLLFNFVDVVVLDTGDSLIDSNSGTAPTVTIKFIKTNVNGTGTGVILKAIGVGNLNAASNIFVDSRSNDNPLQLNDWPVTLLGGGSVNTSGTITSVPGQSIFVSPNMNLQGAIDSLVSLGLGGIITLLPGTYNITSPILIDGDNIQIVGFGDTSVISASGFTGGATVGAIQVGLANGSAPVNGVTLMNFKLEVTGTGGSDIHGIRVAGGEDIRVDNVTVQKMSGASGSAATARMGIQMIDGVGGCTGVCVLTRPVIINSRVLGNGGTNYFTDGIHVTSDPSIGGVFGNNQGVINALLDGNFVDYVSETAYVFVGSVSSSLFNNRASRMGAGGGGAYGIFMSNVQNVNMTANVFSGSLSLTAIAIGIESFNTGGLKETLDSIFNANIIDGFGNGGVGFATGFQIGNATNTGFHRNSLQSNVIKGAVAGAAVAIDLRGNADDNSFSFNALTGGVNPWDTGVNLQSATQERNQIISNRDTNVSTLLIDNGAATIIGDDLHVATINPTVNDNAADGYEVGTLWVNTTLDDAFILLDSTVGAAVWTQIDGAGAGSSILDDAYNNDSGERTITVDGGDVSWDLTGANQFVIDLQATGDFIIQDAGVTFATFADNGDFNLTNNLTVGASAETIANGSFVLNGDDVFIADSLGVEGAIYSDTGSTKYFFLDIDGGVSNSVTVGNKIGGLVPVIRLDAGGDSQVRWTFPVPDDWISGTNILATVYWSPSNTNTGNVQWEVSYASVPNADTLTGADFTTLTPPEAANGTTDQVQLEAFTIPSGVLAADEIVFFTVNRDGGAGGDTYTGNVDIHVVRVQYTGKKIQ